MKGFYGHGSCSTEVVMALHANGSDPFSVLSGNLISSGL